jgi:hypothetical protein
MYLNRAVFKDRFNANSSFNFSEPAVSGGGTDMDRVIYYTSLLINSGKYSLESDYFKNFARDNNNGKELIFAISQKIDYIRNGSNSFAYVVWSVTREHLPQTEEQMLLVQHLNFMQPGMEITMTRDFNNIINTQMVHGL